MNIDMFIARAQRNITYLYFVLFAGALGGLLFMPKPIDQTINTLLVGMVGVLGTLLSQQSSFWFGRPRPAGVPDPATTTTQTTITTTPSADDAHTPSLPDQPTKGD